MTTVNELKMTGELYKELVSNMKDTQYKKAFDVASKFVSKSGARPSITGVFHDEQGRMIATDSHRMIRISNVWKEQINSFIVNKDNKIIESNYPQTDRLFPDKQDAKTMFRFSTRKYIIDILKGLNKLTGSFGIPTVKIIVKDGKMKFEPGMKVKEVRLNLSFEFDVELENNSIDEFVITVSTRYLYEMLEGYKKMGINTVDVYFYGEVLPLLFTPSHGDLEMEGILLPVRTF